MLLQTNSYIVPRDKRNEHARLLRRFRQCLLRLGCDHFEVYEQVGANWSSSDATGRFVQIMRFRDRRHQLEVQAAERADKTAQILVREFCELINFGYQQQQGLFAVGYYTSFLRMPPAKPRPAIESDEPTAESVEAMQAALASIPEPGASPYLGNQDEIPASEGGVDMHITSLSNPGEGPDTETAGHADTQEHAEVEAAPEPLDQLEAPEGAQSLDADQESAAEAESFSESE